MNMLSVVMRQQDYLMLIHWTRSRAKSGYQCRWLRAIALQLMGQLWESRTPLFSTVGFWEPSQRLRGRKVSGKGPLTFCYSISPSNSTIHDWLNSQQAFVISYRRAVYNGLNAGLQRQMCFASVRLGMYEPTKRFYQGLLKGTTLNQNSKKNN